MSVYIYEQRGWPRFTWDTAAIVYQLAAIRHRQGRLLGRMESLGLRPKAEAELETLTEEVVKSSEIEGEILDRGQVRSSLASRLGVDIGALTPAERNVEGIVDMILNATRNFADALTEERLFGWHAALFPTGRSGMSRIKVGGWRNDAAGPMQVVSGAIGRERVHFQAPAASALPREMARFLAWLDQPVPIDPVIKAALAHLWFVTIHPFDDGNGRIARAIADMALSRSENCARRFYSMSSQIRIERKAYYDILERTQKGDLDVTAWLQWFLGCLDRAFAGSEAITAGVLRRARFWESRTQDILNDRQRTMINRLLVGFDGKLTSSKWAKIMKCSQDTAHRDIVDLVERGILIKEEGGGRSTSYALLHPAIEGQH